jgi:organic radical activating enzyme
MSLKIRIFPEHNYKGLHINGKTLRIALDPSKPITELKYPEFYDVKVTSYCKGHCSYCYQDSEEVEHTSDIIKKFQEYFGKFTANQMPFQIAFGGGEPTSHPDFSKLMEASYNMGIVPNYTTNGMWVDDIYKVKNIIDTTIKYCGGVAVSTHPHLEKYWRMAVSHYLQNDIFTNLHVILSDKKSVDDFMKIYNEYTGKIKYFVVLPLSAQGRAKEAHIDWDYIVKMLPEKCADIAFGANFYPYLCETPGRFPVSLYEPESMSGYLDLHDMKVYKSSFSSELKTIG